MNHPLRVAALLVVASAALPACATKTFVNNSVADVNRRVETLTRSLESTQEHGKVTDARLGEVDRTAQRAQDTAQQANGAALSAGTRADAAAAKADALDVASKRLIYTVVLSEGEGQIAFGKSALPPEALARIDELAARIKADPKGAFFEIEGHTDAIGPKEFNEQLGLKRAEAAKRYLYEKHQIPLHRINVISYGSEKPVAPNNTKDGRAQNRRIVINVLI